MCLYMYKHVLSNMCVFISIYCIFIFSLAWCHIGAHKIFRQIADLKILKSWKTNLSKPIKQFDIQKDIPFMTLAKWT